MKTETKELKVLIACESSGVVMDKFYWNGHDAWSCDLLPADDDHPCHNRHIQGDVREVIESDDWDMVLMVGHPPCTRLCSSGTWKIKGASSYLICDDCGAFNSAKHWKKHGSCRSCGGKNVSTFNNTISPITGEYCPKEMLEGKLTETELLELWDEFLEGVDLFKYLMSADAPKIAIENPIMSSLAKEYIWGENWEQVWKDDGMFRQTSVQPWHFAEGIDCPNNTSKETFLWLKDLPALERTGNPDLTQATSRKDCHNATPSADRWKIRSKFASGIAQAMADQWGDMSLWLQAETV